MAIAWRLPWQSSRTHHHRDRVRAPFGTGASHIELPLHRTEMPYPASESGPALDALTVMIAALQRRESRGAHFRTDVPRSKASYEKRLPLTLGAALHAAQVIAQPWPGARRA